MSSAIRALATGGTEARTAWGSTISRITPVNGRPIGAGCLGLAERHGVDAGAERLTDEGGGVESQRDARRVEKNEVKSKLPMWTSTHLKLMPILGAANWKKKKIISSGVLRTSVT